jgi:lysophospholipase L1-like esterase
MFARALGLALLALIPAAATAGPIYLALGDSSAFGETNRTRDPSNGDRGYVAPFADFLATRNGGQRPTVLNLAIDGETSASWATGTGRVSSDGLQNNSNYAPFAPNYPTQQDYFHAQVAAAKARGDTISTVTVQFGANDLDATAHSPGFGTLDPAVQSALVLQTLGTLQSNYAALLADIKKEVPAADLYVIGYHNPYAGNPSDPLAPLAAPAVQGLNQVVAGLGDAFGAKYVDFYHVILGREDELTLINSGDPMNNVHMNDKGYALAAQELIRVAAAPEPGTLVLLGLAFVGGVGYRRVRQTPTQTAA